MIEELYETVKLDSFHLGHEQEIPPLEDRRATVFRLRRCRTSLVRNTSPTLRWAWCRNPLTRLRSPALRQRAGPAAVFPHDDDGVAALCRSRCAGFSHHPGFSQASPEAAGRPVLARSASLRIGRIGEARSLRAGRHQDQNQRVEAQGNDLRPHGGTRHGAGSRGPAGCARPRRRTLKRTSCAARTTPARRCRDGSLASGSASKR
jgi:hypothetical protein